MLIIDNLPPIKKLDKDHWSKTQKKFDNLIKPVGSLAKLEDITCLYATAHMLENVVYPDKCLLLFVDEHGVADEYPEKGLQDIKIFSNQVKNSKSALDILAASLDSKIQAVFLHEEFGRTNNIVKQEAMSEKQFMQAFVRGRKTVADIIKNGCTVLGLGNFSSGSNLSMPVLTMASFTKNYAQISINEDLAKKKILDKIFAVHDCCEKNIIELTIKFGGFAIPAMAGAILQAAGGGVPIFLDGSATLFAAYLACQIDSRAGAYLIAVSTTMEDGQNMLLKQMGLSTMLDLKISYPAGEASLFGLNLLDAGIKALNEMDSFGNVHFPLGDIN